MGVEVMSIICVHELRIKVSHNKLFETLYGNKKMISKRDTQYQAGYHSYALEQNICAH